MAGPFDYIKSFLDTKQSLYDTESLFIKDYPPFVINRALSNDPKCTLFADALNTYPSLDAKLQHDFYFYGLPRMRTGKMWTKKEEDGQIKNAKAVSELMQVSLKRAYELLQFIDEEEIDAALKLKGGKTK